MMQETFLLRFFWGPRREGVEEVAARLLLYLEQLTAFDTVYSHWYPRSGRGSDQSKSAPLLLETGAIEELCRREIQREEVAPFKPIAPLGFTVNLATGGLWDLTLRINCGGYSHYVLNSITMPLPATGSAGKRLCRAESLIGHCRLIIACWDPEVGQVWSGRLDDELGNPDQEIDVGWMTYVANRRLVLPEFDRAIEVIPIGEAGQLIVATRQRFSTANGNHLRRAKLIASKLNGGGVERSNR
ncbi:Imm52 family immunity protein [Tundrisphaera sp. TA3]|uniref:Imm52 family immunity protein n=1 Tax=Tundrisphaera sp. TA3 TaxID=3435775 RepID=UPI003EBE97DD